MGTANIGFGRGISVATLGWSRGGRATRGRSAALGELGGTPRADSNLAGLGRMSLTHSDHTIGTAVPRGTGRSFVGGTIPSAELRPIDETSAVDADRGSHRSGDSAVGESGAGLITSASSPSRLGPWSAFATGGHRSGRPATLALPEPSRAMSRTESRPLLSGSVKLAGAEPAPFRSLTAASPAPPTHGRLSPVTTSIFMMPGLLESMAWWTVQGQARFGLGVA